MSRTPRLTRREEALLRIIDTLRDHVEALGCTCGSSETHDRLHEVGGRRRRDSACTGVALAVTAALQCRRALRLKRDA